MLNLSENYYLRKCFLQREQVPTQRMMRDKMTPALADIYFNFMTPKLKELAGLEPRLKGGGNNWFMPPEEVLEGRAVLKPGRKEVISKLNSVGIETIGETMFQKHRKLMDEEIEQALLDSEINWRKYVTATTRRLWDDLVAEATKKNSDHIMKDFNEFTYLYRQSVGKIEILFHESAIAEIKNTKENAIHEMQSKYATALEDQATLLYGQYEKKLKEEKTRLKMVFMEQLDIYSTAMGDKIHDLKVDKHMAVQNCRQYFHCQNLACRIYVALKEREKCFNEIEVSKVKHKKSVKIMSDTILNEDLEIRLKKEKEKKLQAYLKDWQKKVCRVVKSFQILVSYFLNMLPEHAEFFINMEKLMLLQVNKALVDPTAVSIIELETEQFHTPIPRPKPFYLFCDKGYKPKVEQDLCPKHSGTSSASGSLPVMIINKQCLYAACDNFDQFINKIKEYINGSRGDDVDFTDDLVYEHFVPVKYGSSQQQLETNLQSSLLQILQQEMENVQTEEGIVPNNWRDRGLSWCVCPPCPATLRVDGGEKTKLAPLLLSPPTASHHKLQSMDRSMELVHERELKWESYRIYVEPKKCSCAKIAKKHLTEHLPAYMRQMKYGPPEMLGYEICSIKQLKLLVQESRKTAPPLAPPPVVPSRTKDMSTQCNYPILESMWPCTCYSDDEFSKFIKNIEQVDYPKHSFNLVSPSFLEQPASSFAMARAQSLRNLIEDYSDLGHLFKKNDCRFE